MPRRATESNTNQENLLNIHWVTPNLARRVNISFFRAWRQHANAWNIETNTCKLHRRTKLHEKYSIDFLNFSSTVSRHVWNKHVLENNIWTGIGIVLIDWQTFLSLRPDRIETTRIIPSSEWNKQPTLLHITRVSDIVVPLRDFTILLNCKYEESRSRLQTDNPCAHQ